MFLFKKKVKMHREPSILLGKSMALVSQISMYTGQAIAKQYVLMTIVAFLKAHQVPALIITAICQIA